VEIKASVTIRPSRCPIRTTIVVPERKYVRAIRDGAGIDRKCQWEKIEGDGDELVANGVTNVKWDELSTSKLMVSFTQAAEKKTRLVEFKAF